MRLGSKTTTYVFGDTPSDIAAARQAGLPIISVATGIYPFDALEPLDPDLCVSCCTDLLATPQVKA